MSLRKRLPTAIGLLAVTYAVCQYGPRIVLFIFAQAFIVGALVEFYGLAEKNGLRPQTALGIGLSMVVSLSFYLPAFPLEIALFAILLAAAVYFVAVCNTPEKLPFFPASIALTILGPVYISFPLNYIYKIRIEEGPYVLYFLFAVIFLGDTGAMFIGKAIGRHKMTPIASPNKTWEGSAGGILFAVGGALLARHLMLGSVPVWVAVASAVLIHAAAQVSDPLESLFKRAVGVKDSSNALPGHGGFLDRIDSLILASPLFYFVVKFFWK